MVKYAIRCGGNWLTNGFPEWGTKPQRMFFPNRGQAYAEAAKLLAKLPYPGLRVVGIRRPLRERYSGVPLHIAGGYELDLSGGTYFGHKAVDSWMQRNAGKKVRLTLEVFE